MGLLSWLFPSEADRVAKARKVFERGDPGQARLLIEGLEGPEAEALREQVFDRLVQLNLEAVEHCANAAELDAAAEHLELAERFASSRHRDALREARGVLREARVVARAVAPPKKKSGGAGHSGCASGSCGTREAIPPEAPSPGFGADPIWSLPHDHPQVRYALLLETYPEALRERFLALGAAFAEAVLLLEDGEHRRAFEALEPFVAQDPVVRLPRAQAAVAMKQLPRAASELRAFADAYGHQRAGNFHTGVLLARALGGDGRLQEALDLVRSLRATDDDLELHLNEVVLLETLGRLPEADEAGRALLRRAPGDLGIHKLLARIRVKGGERTAAMQVLESGLTRLCKGPGKCGSQPFDVEAGRFLAQLYLEDRVQPKRAEELLAEIAKYARQPEWIDGYLRALVARNGGGAELDALVEGLLQGLPEGDARRALVEGNLLAG
jgi:tetratricopeptide (TPR) repeat protein